LTQTLPYARRYASFYLTRNSLAYVAPAMLKDPGMGMDLAKVGGLTSILPVAYGFSKFLSGVLGARTSPVMLLAGARRRALLPALPPVRYAFIFSVRRTIRCSTSALRLFPSWFGH
jgi:hypothetical protein